MTDLGELVAIAIAKDAECESKCPFCYEKEKGHDKAPGAGEDEKELKSNPSALGELGIGQKKDSTETYKFWRARHHIIPAMQCLAKLPRLARMAMAAGYNVNDGDKNGIGLPTVLNQYTIGGHTRNYGSKKFDDSVRRTIAFAVMKKTGKQWHVGHHHYKIPVEEGNVRDSDDEGGVDHMSYDMEVIVLLIQLMYYFEEEGFCKDDDDRSGEICDDINEISQDIREKLDMFKTKPKGSAPFYVSLLSKFYADES